jgi:aminoglycoside phosphotransferase (APT) family kinase protein
MEGFEKLPAYLSAQWSIPIPEIHIKAFKGGFSNLTYLIESESFSYVLRRPPFGNKISKAHDMVREFKILTALEKAGYDKIPKAILCCEDESILGAPFFIMEKVDGLIIRNKRPEHVTADFFTRLSKSSIDVLLELHGLELTNSGLINLGKPEGYVARQVAGWSERYLQAQTDDIPELKNAFDWLARNQPEHSSVAFIHNDFKFDNMVIREDASVAAVLDWEMATVGDPLMDLGTTLAYWAEEGDPYILKMFNLSYVDGNFSRAELVEYYASKSNLDVSKILFYYVFGLCKVAVIAQQIYKRYALGFSTDERFSVLNQVVKAAGIKAMESIKLNKI